MVTRRLLISGTVQGVYYRGWTSETARELGLSGWVRNRRDGTVEAIFSGAQASVEEMIRRCRTGPSGAAVTEISIEEVDVFSEQGFSVRPTA